jgi:hypothetical protein
VALVAFGALRLTGSTRTHPASPAPLPANGFRVAAPAALPGDDRPAAVRLGKGRWGAAAARHVYIPSLGVAARWVRVGSEGAGSGPQIPRDVHTLGLWKGGAGPKATAGTTLLAGHVNYTGQGKGALYPLFRVRPGAVVVLTGDRAERTVWRVVELQVFDKTALPRRIFAADGARQLVLVTCGGPLLRVTGPAGSYNTYRDNVVVTAEPVRPSASAGGR